MKRSTRRNATPPGAWEAGIPDADIEIRVAEGADGERLADQQARILWEITKWQLDQSNSDSGQEKAA